MIETLPTQGLKKPSSVATARNLCERAFEAYKDACFEGLAGISNGHLSTCVSMTYQAKQGSGNGTELTHSYFEVKNLAEAQSLAKGNAITVAYIDDADI